MLLPIVRSVVPGIIRKQAAAHCQLPASAWETPPPPRQAIQQQSQHQGQMVPILIVAAQHQITSSILQAMDSQSSPPSSARLASRGPKASTRNVTPRASRLWPRRMPRSACRNTIQAGKPPRPQCLFLPPPNTSRTGVTKGHTEHHGQQNLHQIPAGADLGPPSHRLSWIISLEPGLD